MEVGARLDFKKTKSGSGRAMESGMAEFSLDLCPTKLVTESTTKLFIRDLNINKGP